MDTGIWGKGTEGQREGERVLAAIGPTGRIVSILPAFIGTLCPQPRPFSLLSNIALNVVPSPLINALQEATFKATNFDEERKFRA